MKFIYRIVVFVLTVVLWAGVAMASSSQTTQTPEAAGFIDAPAKGLAKIYKDYHDWKVSDGIKKALSALTEVDVLYAGNPEAVLDDKGLRLNKAGQIKSTLHTLLGMLYYRKALLVQRDSDDGAVGRLMEKIKSGSRVTEADLENVALEAEQGTSADDRKNSLVSMAINEFVSASAADPKNPSPHYQLARIYSAIESGKASGKAEQEYFIAAELSYQEGNRGDAIKVLATIKEMNPDSDYARRLELMVAQ